MLQPPGDRPRVRLGPLFCFQSYHTRLLLLLLLTGLPTPQLLPEEGREQEKVLYPISENELKYNEDS